jgi:hypothetical protein
VLKKGFITLVYFGILALGLLLTPVGCSRTIEPESQLPAEQKETAMPPESQMRPTIATIPPIDAAAPQTFDTATFGLG